MSKLGISIYPNHSKPEEDQAYIVKANQYGFSRVFTNLLFLEGNKEEVLQDFRQTISYAKKLDMEVICDISPRIFEELNISYDDLSFFDELGVDGLRLDKGFTGNEESIMTFNPYNLKIEINMSDATSYLEKILDHQPKKENLIGCHNFYPHYYSGLSYSFFMECSERFKKYGLRTAAFVSSTDAEFGPWPVTEGLPTLESHRELPIETQAKHLYATNLIDDIIIANAYASEKELKKLSELNKNKMTFNVTTVETASNLENTIIFDEPHFYRGDVSDYMIRSTQSRVKYRRRSFPVHHTPDIKRGDIIIESDLYQQYAGELQIALLDMKNSGKSNVVGRIREDEIFLIDYLKPWEKFAFTSYSL